MIIEPKVFRPIPPPEHRFLDAEGRVEKAWYDYLRDLDMRTRRLTDASNDYETRITALEP